MIGFSSFIRDPADKVRFFEAYSDITGSGKEGITAYSLFIKYLIKYSPYSVYLYNNIGIIHL